MTDLIKPMAEFSVEGPLKSISFDIGSYNVVISESIVVQWIVMLVLGIVFFILGRNLKVRSTSRRQMAAEYLVNFFNNMVRDTMGEKYRKYGLCCILCILLVKHRRIIVKEYMYSGKLRWH